MVKVWFGVTFWVTSSCRVGESHQIMLTREKMWFNILIKVDFIHSLGFENLMQKDIINIDKEYEGVS